MFGAAVQAAARSISARESSGAAAVEFALFVPFFMLVIAGTFNGFGFLRAGDRLAARCMSVGAPSYRTFFRGAFRTPRGLSQRYSWVLASKRSGSCSSLLLTVS